MTLMEAARMYAEERHWTPIALGLDGSGFPKRPLLQGWTGFKPEDWAGQPWERANGIGLLLGSPSNNLAAIDVDDVELSDAVWSLIVRRHLPCRMARTARGRLHVYVKEAEPSRTRPLKVHYKDRLAPVELRASNVQVTVPPTPGYALTGYEDGLDADPIAAPSIAAAWASLASHLGIEANSETTVGASVGYPLPWQPTVTTGDRNRAMYVEAHKLRGARMPFEQAVEVLRVRFEAGYEKGDVSWEEMKRTIRSAYRGGPAPNTPALEWNLT